MAVNSGSITELFPPILLPGPRRRRVTSRQYSAGQLIFPPYLWSNSEEVELSASCKRGWAPGFAVNGFSNRLTCHPCNASLSTPASWCFPMQSNVLDLLISVARRDKSQSYTEITSCYRFQWNFSFAMNAIASLNIGSRASMPSEGRTVDDGVCGKFLPLMTVISWNWWDDSAPWTVALLHSIFLSKECRFHGVSQRLFGLPLQVMLSSEIHYAEENQQHVVIPALPSLSFSSSSYIFFSFRLPPVSHASTSFISHASWPILSEYGRYSTGYSFYWLRHHCHCVPFLSESDRMLRVCWSCHVFKIRKPLAIKAQKQDFYEWDPGFFFLKHAPPRGGYLAKRKGPRRHL